MSLKQLLKRKIYSTKCLLENQLILQRKKVQIKPKKAEICESPSQF